MATLAGVEEDLSILEKEFSQTEVCLFYLSLFVFRRNMKLT